MDSPVPGFAVTTLQFNIQFSETVTQELPHDMANEIAQRALKFR
jgi:hypothetical protein